MAHIDRNQEKTRDELDKEKLAPIKFLGNSSETYVEPKLVTAELPFSKVLVNGLFFCYNFFSFGTRIKGRTIR